MSKALLGPVATAVPAGCGLLPAPEVEAPPVCPFPDGTMVTVVGETPLATLGLIDGGVGPDPPGGTVYVTTQPVARFQGDPIGQWWCVVFLEDPPGRLAEGSSRSGSTGPVPQGWTPPDG